MDGMSDPSIDHETIQAEAFPDGLTPGSTVLIAGAVEPTRYAVDLRALCRYSHAADAAIIVTTTESADQTVDTYETICAESDRAEIDGAFRDRFLVDRAICSTPKCASNTASHLETRPSGVHECIGTLRGDISLNDCELHDERYRRHQEKTTCTLAFLDSVGIHLIHLMPNSARDDIARSPL